MFLYKFHLLKSFLSYKYPKALLQVLHKFYGPFMDDVRRFEEECPALPPAPPEVSDVQCEKCGAMMVIKEGRFGKFLACPNFPNCRNAKPIVKKIGVPCPLCGGEIIERKTKTGKIFYGCEKYPECEFTTWDLPLNESCPQCGHMLLEHTERNGRKRKYCSNPECTNARPVRAAAKEDAPDSNPNPMFQNAVTVDASNGYILKLPNYSIDPAYSWVSKFSFQPIISYMTARSSGCTSSTGSTITLTNDNYNYYREKVDEEGNAIPGEMTGVEGDVLNNMYQRFEIANMAEAMEIDFRLNNVYSADYCIKMTLVPSNINYDIVNEDQQADFYENLCFSAEIIDDSDKSCGKVTYAYKKDGEKDDSNKKDAIIIDPMTGVTTLTLFPKFHFDKCYVDVPCPTGDTFPRLRITVPRGGGRNKIVYASLNIVEISCEPYRAE